MIGASQQRLVAVDDTAREIYPRLVNPPPGGARLLFDTNPFADDILNGPIFVSVEVAVNLYPWRQHVIARNFCWLRGLAGCVGHGELLNRRVGWGAGSVLVVL